MKFKILYSTDSIRYLENINILKKDVNRHIENGWKPIGGLTISESPR